jgi:hypothetical protein
MFNSNVLNKIESQKQEDDGYAFIKIKSHNHEGDGGIKWSFYLYTCNRHLESIKCWQYFMFQNDQNLKLSKAYTIHISKPHYHQLGKVHI